MTLALFSWPLFRAWDANGLPLAGGKLYSYAAGTSTPLSLLAADGTTPLANPVILSASGQAECRLRPAAYKLNLFSALDVQQADWPVDNVTFTTTDTIAGLSATVAAMRVQTDPGEAGTESLATTLAGEHERLRYRIAEIAGATYWYETKSGIRAQNLATASLPAAAIAGRLARVSDGTRGLWMDNGTAWLPVNNTSANVKEFGATGDGTTNDYTAIAAAIASGSLDIVFPPGNYKITSPLAMVANQTLRGIGGLRAATITKGANGNLIEMSTLGEVSNLNMDLKGQTFTGYGIHIPSGVFSAKIHRCRLIDGAGQCIYFDASSGGGTMMSELEGNAYDQVAQSVIAGAGDVAATPRFIDNCWFSGGWIDISGLNDVFISNCYLHHIQSSPTTSNFYINNVRWALSGDAVTLSGAGGMLSNCSFAGAVTLTNTSGIRFSDSCEFGFGITEGSGCLFNGIVFPSTAYTPTWTQTSGAQPSLGNGTITGRYLRQGTSCQIQIILTMGSTTTFGNNATGYLFSIPFSSHNASGFVQQFPSVCKVYDTSVPLDYFFSATLNNNELAISCGLDGAGLRDGYPIAWATGDIVTISLTYHTK